MGKKIIGRFVPTGAPDYRQPFNVLTMEPSHYLAPAWTGEKENGETYHVIERAWRFEPVWTGDGLPPIGVECEWQDKNTKKWVGVLVVYASEWVTVIRENKPVDPVELAIENYGDEALRKFRPVRSEAELKRDESIEALHNNLMRVKYKAEEIYNAIAEGKIPGIKLEK